ncbi:MAG: tRNA (adenosine(37)-N6)-dimethylallyltransferase MiaA [Bacteroidetes bacterium]|nr:MAG: tRNA (adenosine(37)-N6)-dimethylallyltransferase MiaA [Bacteroidota bacterium]REK08033.1 MAG: tRNA (adenosine(37)-N6)-dimethylallyltransferase MiaA [Bacteroidota bacterium]REK32238.1 MAG: tRNA (adenosine(37)-N6)-dimethylallyltransferase MiaA [Bacteroidota bacterium]REK47390.1 MAG: tRNA (adenosine(37)-N6)-dimethylallyltransferase MiaA [Bacteroidota bacterium]
MMKKLLIIKGPTASGKTAAAISLAKHFGCEIINSDSRQFYKGLDIATAKPDTGEMKEVRHHFIDHLEPDQNYNARQFEKDVLLLLEKLFVKYDVAIMTGGSGLYVNAVCYGMDELPGSDEKIRAELNSIYAEYGIVKLQEMLRDLDPDFYHEVDTSNPQRLIRAIEVCQISGLPYSTFRTRKISKRNFEIIQIILEIEREELYRRIDERVDMMVKNGLLEETLKLQKFREFNSMKTVGYNEIFRFIDKEISLDEAISLIKQHSRNYAKRQMTWLRRDKDSKWIRYDDHQEMIRYAEYQIKNART